MDEDVRKALARWPNVPAAYGWLSLNPRGAWRFHRGGNANLGSAGEPIGNTRIQAFIGRNYTHDDKGRWFFQNGPQRVYLRLDTAPYIVHQTTEGRLVTHTGSIFGPVARWILDDAGRMYAQSDTGPAAIDDRDLAAVCESLHLEDGAAAIDELACMAVGDTLFVRHRLGTPLIQVTCVPADQVPATLAFIRAPEEPTPTASGLASSVSAKAARE
ncbi:MAG: DUF2946 family protein [Burkholderiaceae bacterium]|nr:DUF2946 family protein [Burkholderiaceae bacterium]